jgi:hypothetical protein
MGDPNRRRRNEDTVGPGGDLPKVPAIPGTASSPITIFSRTGYRFVPSCYGPPVPETQHHELPMSNPQESFRIDLTPEQKTAIRNATGKDAEAVELSVEELEARIAPTKVNFKG